MLLSTIHYTGNTPADKWMITQGTNKKRVKPH